MNGIFHWAFKRLRKPTYTSKTTCAAVKKHMGSHLVLIRFGLTKRRERYEFLCHSP